jgi:hypothetical protein
MDSLRRLKGKSQSGELSLKETMGGFFLGLSALA